MDRFRNSVDVNSSALLNFVSAQRWLGARIELLGSIVVLVSSVLVVSLNQSLFLEPGIGECFCFERYDGVTCLTGARQLDC